MPSLAGDSRIVTTDPERDVVGATAGDTQSPTQVKISRYGSITTCSDGSNPGSVIASIAAWRPSTNSTRWEMVASGCASSSSHSAYPSASTTTRPSTGASTPL